MKSFFYPRLAFTNIKKQAQIYIPYLITSIFTVMMYYMMYSLASNPGLQYEKLGSSVVPVVLELGTYVLMIFAFIFLFYINSFIMKRRKKEFALYNILGMEKKHVMFILFFETLLVMLISIFGGIIFGSLLNQLLYLILVRLCHLNTALSFVIHKLPIIAAFKLFIPLFSLTFLFNILQINLTKPIELLRGGEIGEKEPQVKWFIGIIGFICLGMGYYLSQVIEDPVMSLVTFFIAVVLVIIGTYCLFTVGSIMVLKALKKNKRFYYQTRHFVSVSQMMYRMKQNAVGLASICILCTCILVMLSSTVTLYASIEDTTNKMLEEDSISVLYTHDSKAIDNLTYQDVNKYYQSYFNELSNNNIGIKNKILKRTFSRQVFLDDEKICDDFISPNSKRVYLIGMTLDDYNYAYHKNEVLNDDEVLMNNNVLSHQDITINNYTFKNKKIINDLYLDDDYGNGILEDEYRFVVVFKNYDILNNVMNKQHVSSMNYILSLDFINDIDAKKADDILDKNYSVYGVGKINDYDMNTYYNSQVMLKQGYTDMFGGLLFLGIFLGIVFLMAAIIIMYYKQLSEGYEDQKRYEILQNVGMTQKEVKQAIRSQVLIFFFLPIVVAIIHMGFAFNIISQMFQVLVLSDVSLFITCTIVSCLILLIIYTIVYLFTAKTYYKIVQK